MRERKRMRDIWGRRGTEDSRETERKIPKRDTHTEREEILVIVREERFRDREEIPERVGERQR